MCRRRIEVWKILKNLKNKKDNKKENKQMKKDKQPAQQPKGIKQPKEIKGAREAKKRERTDIVLVSASGDDGEGVLHGLVVHLVAAVLRRAEVDAVHLLRVEAHDLHLGAGVEGRPDPAQPGASGSAPIADGGGSGRRGRVRHVRHVAGVEPRLAADLVAVVEVRLGEALRVVIGARALRNRAVDRPLLVLAADRQHRLK